jgi:menaquinone-dependent protoporphyrinogen oxidase
MSTSPFNPLGPAHFDPLKAETGVPGRHSQRVAVLFATREGHAKRIAERIMFDLLSLGFDSDLLAVKRHLPFDLSYYSAALLIASVHTGHHEKEMVRFVRDHKQELETIPTAFVSVTLSEAGAEMPDKSPAERAKFVRDVDLMIGRFFYETQWRPSVAKPVAGALLYTHYNFLVRMVMKNIARKAGASTDTSRNYDYTNWPDLDKFVEDFTARLRPKPVEGPAPTSWAVQP